MNRTRWAILAVLLTGGLCVALASAQQKKSATGAHRGHRMVTPDAIKWGPAPESWVQGTPPPEFAGPMKFQWAVIDGDPSKAGAPFTIRVKGPDGERVAPHWHPQDEHLTVLQGTFVLGMGEKFDKAAGKELPAGSYAAVPRRSMHFGWVKGETIVEVHGTGPFVINFGKPAEAAKKAPTAE